MTNTATPGDRVRVHYTGTLASGEVFDSSSGREPLPFTLGVGDVVPGFDAAVESMAVGETKTVTIPAAEAYGERDDGMTVEVDRSQLPDGVAVGDRLAVGLASGGQVPVTVTAIGEESAVLDANHELAGHDLTFEITLVDINGGVEQKA